jgi:hypothetical protein
MRLLFFAQCALPAATPDPLYRALRTSEIAESFPVENLVLKRDAGVLTLKSGAIGFTAPAQGRDTIAVFVGEGEFSFDPPLGIEKAHLKQVIDQDNVRETFARASFVFTDESGKEFRGTAKSRPAAGLIRMPQRCDFYLDVAIRPAMMLPSGAKW